MRSRRQGQLFNIVAVAAMSVAVILTGCTVATEQTVTEEVLVYPPPPERPRYYFERTLLGSTDVVEETTSDRLRMFATGESSRGRGFAKPFDVLAVDGRIFIGDTVARRVAVLDFPRKRYFEIGTEGKGRLRKPLGIAADKQGLLYVLDGTAKRIQVYDLDGNHIRTIGHAVEMKRPSGLAVNADGSRLYVVDAGGVENREHMIRVLDSAGELVKTIGQRGKDEGNFNLPLKIAIGPGEKLHVVDAGNFRVQIFSPDGEFLSTFGEPGRFPGMFSHPKGIAVDREGKIFVVDTGFANFQIFDSEGRLLLFIGQRSESGGGPGRYLLPAGISVDGDGRVYVVDQFYRKVDVFRPAELPADAPIGYSADAPAL